MAREENRLGYDARLEVSGKGYVIEEGCTRSADACTAAFYAREAIRLCTDLNVLAFVRDNDTCEMREVPAHTVGESFDRLLPV